MNHVSHHSFRFNCLAVSVTTAMALAGCNQPGAPAPTPTASAPKSAQTQIQGFTVSASVPSVRDGTEVKLLSQAMAVTADSNKPLATATVERGRFVLTGHVSRPQLAMLQVGKRRQVPMIIGNTSFKVIENDAGLAVKGGKYNDQVFGYMLLPDYIKSMALYKKALAKAMVGVDMSDVHAVDLAYVSVADNAGLIKAQQIRRTYQSKILDGDAPVLVKLFTLRDNNDRKRYDKAKRAAMLASYEKVLGPNPLIVAMQQEAKAAEQAARMRESTGVGKPYKDVIAVNMAGKKVDLAKVLGKNKMVLLDFWASWCGPCRGEFPAMRKVYQKYHAKGFEIYAVSLDQDKGAWKKALAEEKAKGGIPWIQLNAIKGFGSKAAQSYGVMGLPSNYLINGKGIIVGTDMRGEKLAKAVAAEVSKEDGQHGA